MISGEAIRRWRPQQFSEIVGRQNQRRLARLQRDLIARRTPAPLLLTGVFGTAKTSVARLVMRALNCQCLNSATADPCGQCTECICSGQQYFGYGDPFRRYEVDCTTTGKAELRELFSDIRFSKNDAVFLDELHHLPEKTSQEQMLKFVEDFPGFCLAAVMEDRLDDLIPPLRERFDIVQIAPPTSSEMRNFLCAKMIDWEVHSDPSTVDHLVRNSGPSFRVSLRAIAAGADVEERVLTKELVNDILGL